MRDLIDRERLIKELLDRKFDDLQPDDVAETFYNAGLSRAIKFAKKMPSVDAVEVVFCKDCVYCYEGHYEEPGEPEYIKRHCEYRFNKGKGVMREPLDFCSYGRKSIVDY